MARAGSGHPMGGEKLAQRAILSQEGRVAVDESVDELVEEAVAYARGGGMAPCVRGV